VGPLPGNWSSLTGLSSLDLSGNALSGQVPPSWAQQLLNASAPGAVDLGGNAQLCGPLPGSWGANGTAVVVVSGTQLGQPCSDAALLLAVKAQLDSSSLGSGSNDSSALLPSWQNDGTHPCGPPAPWERVVCSAPGGVVLGLDLSGLDLVGSLPPAMQHVTSLQQLNMSANNLTGGAGGRVARDAGGQEGGHTFGQKMTVGAWAPL
jgi:hypothetical protein